MLKKTEAIVLKSQRQGETSKILTLFTRAFGKLTVMAKGARRVRSKFGGSLEPVNYISIVYYEKESREIQLLSQADIIESFAGIKQDLDKTAIAMAACELINSLQIGGEPNPTLFNLHLETLRAIDNGDKPMNSVRAFQVKLFDILGINPNFTTCTKCQKHSHGAVGFEMSHGGFVCGECSQGRAPGMVLSPDSLQALRSFQQNSSNNLNGLLTSPTSEQQVDEFISSYMKYHLESVRELKSIKFLKKIRSN